MTNPVTDPGAYDSEATGAWRVQQLSAKERERQAEEQLAAYDAAVDAAAVQAVTPIFPVVGNSPGDVALIYTATNGSQYRVDFANELTHRSGEESDVTHRERLILKALLTHVLAMLNGEDVS